MEIAELIGASRNSVQRAKKRLRERGELPSPRKASRAVSNSKRNPRQWRPPVKERARRELLRDPTRSNVAIAKLLGSDHSYVADVRNKMLAAGELPPPPPTLHECVLQAVRENPEVRPSELAVELGADRNSIYAAIYRARKQIRGHSPIETREG